MLESHPLNATDMQGKNTNQQTNQLTSRYVLKNNNNTHICYQSEIKA